MSEESPTPRKSEIRKVPSNPTSPVDDAPEEVMQMRRKWVQKALF